MSEFVRKLEQVSRGYEQPIGFGPRTKEKPTAMVLIARFEDVDGSRVDEAIKNGADALLFDIEEPISQLRPISEIVKTIEKVPWGVHLKERDAEQIAKLTNEGCDFILVNIKSPAQALLDDEPGKVLEVDTSLVDGLVGAISELSIDVIFLKDRNRQSVLTIDRLLEYHRISSCTGKMLVMEVPQNINDIDVLFESGVRGMVANLSAKDLDTNLTEIKERIYKLSLPQKKGREENRS